jgi:ATP-binding cassette subfamily C protein CydCD
VDAENEAAIQATLDRLMAGRTTLVIAHRLSSVIGCDRILVLADGRVVESGSHAELMSRGGAYRRLMAEQAREAVAPSEALPALAEPAPLGETAAAPEHAAASDPAVPAIGWPRVLATLTRRIRPWAGLLSCTFAFGVGRVVALIAVGVLSAFVVARAAAGEPIGGLILALAILAPAAGLLHWLESWLAHDMAYKLLHHMRIELFRKLDALAPGYLLRRRSGDLVAMATHDIETVEYFYAHTIAPAFVSAVVPPTVLVILLLQGWPIALALLPFLIYVAVVPFLARRRVDRLAAEARAALGELSAFVTDTLQGLPEVFANQAGAHRRRLLEALVARHRRLQKPILRDLTLQSVLIELATGLGGLAVVLSGATLVASGALAPQLLAVLTLLAMAAFLPISEIAEVSRQLADTFAATRRLEVVHGEPVRVLDGPGVAAGDRRGGLAVSASAVTFAYPGTTAPALRDVALDIAPGATVALVGRSGAGKSTLAHLLLRFFDPDKGAIRIGGHDLREWRLDDLRGRVALVAQDTYLFNGTLADNVRLARPDASATELDAALRRSALGEFVDGLPDGLATPVGERGVQLSGGQRQRVAIARAFLKDAPILVLDEATSHLDAESEALVHRALDELRRDRTTFVVAHRLSTVRAADLIVVLDQGRVAETGRHEELLRRGGLYARLVGRQAAASSTPAAAAGT